MKAFGSFISGTLVILVIFYWTGLWNEWNLIYSWFDQLLHFAGGFLIAAIFQYFLGRFYVDALGVINRNFWLKLILGMGFVALAGVLWELHEFAADWWIQRPLMQESASDTMSDLFFGLFGGLSFFFLSELIWRSKQYPYKANYSSKS